MHLVKPLPHWSQSSCSSKHQIQAYTQDRKQFNQNNPGYLVSGINPQSIHAEYQQQCQYTCQCGNCRIILRQSHCQPDDPCYLKQYSNCHHHQSPDTVFCTYLCFFCLSFHANPLLPSSTPSIGDNTENILSIISS